MTRFILILLGIALFFIAITYLLWRIFRGIKIIKYCPAILSLIVSVYFFYLAKTVHIGFQDLANAVLAVMSFAGFVAGLAASLFLDFILPKSK